jgi:hypothetical protein
LQTFHRVALHQNCLSEERIGKNQPLGRRENVLVKPRLHWASLHARHRRINSMRPKSLNIISLVATKPLTKQLTRRVLNTRYSLAINVNGRATLVASHWRFYTPTSEIASVPAISDWLKCRKL